MVTSAVAARSATTEASSLRSFDLSRCGEPKRFHDVSAGYNCFDVFDLHVRRERLEPVVVETRRGPEQLMRILETLARVELTDGLSFAQLIHETTSRLPRDAAVVALLSRVTAHTAAALGNLRRHGFAVTAILNVYEVHEFEEAAGRLLVEGVEARHLKDKAAVAAVCGDYVLT